MLQLARSTAFDETHARQVARLALELFDSSRAAGLHRLGPEERELLEYAALLHDIGTFLSYTRHHQHTYYLIRNADLVGFDQEEIAIMAATAYFHRKALPAPGSRRSPGWTAARARWCGASGRSCGSPSTSTAGTPARSRTRACAARPAASLLELQPAGDWSLEEWAVERRRDSLEKAFGYPLRRRSPCRWSTTDGRPAGGLAGGRPAPAVSPARISAITEARSRLNSLPATVGHTSGKVSTSRSISSCRGRR